MCIILLAIFKIYFISQPAIAQIEEERTEEMLFKLYLEKIIHNGLVNQITDTSDDIRKEERGRKYNYFGAVNKEVNYT